MKLIDTKLPGVFIVEVEKKQDDRGFFGRFWCKKEFADHGIAFDVVQANTSLSKDKGTIRGFHYQVAPRQEAKLIWCTRGSIYDVVLDLRPDSPTYKQWTSVKLDAEQHTRVFVPKGCANAFFILQDNTEACYLVSEFYSPECERGVRWNDPAFKVEWPEPKPSVISEKDSNWPDYRL